MSSVERTRFESWAWIAFALAAATAGLFLFLGLRPGGSGPVLAYRYGLLLLGWASSVGMLVALLWCLRRRPVLQRGRAWPLSALAASLWFCSLPIAYPSSHEGKFSPTRFRLPFDGVARVRHGGAEARRNHLLFDPARRFGTGFERRDGEALRVVAPARAKWIGRAPGREGEVIVLSTGENEYCVLDGLELDADARAPGASLEAGEPLGRAPGLLFIHLQDRPEPGSGEGIPMRFWDYLADGRAAESGIPVPPQEVASAGPLQPVAPTGR